jgi:hypothetical protein
MKVPAVATTDFVRRLTQDHGPERVRVKARELERPEGLTRCRLEGGLNRLVEWQVMTAFMSGYLGDDGGTVRNLAIERALDRVR